MDNTQQSPPQPQGVGSQVSPIIIVDMPTDSNQVVPRKFITANGATVNRPASPVTGQPFYDTTLNKPIWWNGNTATWKDATGANV